ncbi:T9SS type A sorting domain-containing protein [uncultured Muribaculum sp.]|nr:T9SS type A sorting domain-containing protein [uncultured Muribaculum sp.]
MFTGSRSHQDDADGKAVRAAMLPLFSELGINMAFQGHDHIYEVIGPVNNTTKTLASNGVEEVLTVGEPGARENMTGREGGVFNTAAGTLYFLNNSAGKKKYEPRTEEEMIASYSKHEIENYWGLFSGKFGQTGEPTFSRVDVTPESFTVSTYTVDDNGNPTLFDSFKVINNPDGAGIADVAAETTADIRWDAAGYIRISNIAPESVDVYDIEGRNVCHTQSAIIPTDNYTIGLYIVKASAQNKTYTGKILIK